MNKALIVTAFIVAAAFAVILFIVAAANVSKREDERESRWINAHQRVDKCWLDFYVEDGKKMIVLVVLVGLFVVLYIVALIKRPGSRYQDNLEEQNPMEGKMVRFVADEKEKENADGVRGHLEAVGPSNHKSSFYKAIIKRVLDLILSFFGLLLLSPVFLALSLWILIDDPGPVLFKQKRIGKDKQYFALHNVSMKANRHLSRRDAQILSAA